MIKYILLIIGFFLLIKGADFFVEGSSAVAKRLHVPAVIIGLTIVAFGTSLPEASVSIMASIGGKNNLAISNVLGSNLFNLLFVLGAAAIFRTVKAHKNVIDVQFPISIALTVLLEIALCSHLLFGKRDSIPSVNRFFAVILLIVFSLFMYLLISKALKSRKKALSAIRDSKHKAEGEELREELQKDNDLSELSENMPIWKILIFIVGGIVAILLGGKMVVENASEIARAFGFSETFIGLTIVAIGTSLPELVTSIIAAKKGESDLALGNVVGSNIFNIGFILGTSALISPLSVSSEAIFDALILIITSVFAYLFVRKNEDINKKEGIILLLAYIGYFVYIVMR